MAVRFVNNFRAPLAASVSSDSTTFSFPSGYGDLFRAKLGSALGSDHVYGTMFNSGGDIEIVKITETSGDIFTVVRSQDNTSPRAWLSGDYISCRPCAAALTEAVSLPTDLARSGVNIDITELRGLTTPLSVSQGGTGLTSLDSLVSALGLDIDSDVMGYVAPGAAGNVLTSDGLTWTSATPAEPTSSGLGQNQSWQDVKSSRSRNTSYQNTTGNPIQVNIVGYVLGTNFTGSGFQVSTNGSTWVTVAPTLTTLYANDVLLAPFIIATGIAIPNGHYYRLSATPGVGSSMSYTWTELR